MLPNWFNVWNKENPTNVYGPAILVGHPRRGNLFAIMIVVYGQPAATKLANWSARHRHVCD